MSLRVRFDGISKDFGAVRVLHGVRIELEPGRVYGLIGENGARKSTLMKILAGYETASEGELLVDRKPQHFADSRAADLWVSTDAGCSHRQMRIGKASKVPIAQ